MQSKVSALSSSSIKLNEFDLKNAISENRLAGLWRLMTDFRLAYLGATACQGVVALFSMWTNFLLRYLVDDVLQRSDPSGSLPLVALGFVGLALVQGVFSFLSSKLAARMGEGIAFRLRTYLFDHIQRLTFAYHDRVHTGDLIQRVISDVDALRRFFVDQSTSLSRIVLLFGINFVGLLSLNTWLALIVLAGVPLVIGVTFFFQQKIANLYRGFRQQEARLTTTLQESLSGVRVVKAFTRQAFERDKFDRENWGQFLQWRRMAVIRWMYTSVSISFCLALTVVGSYIGALMVMDGAITLGTYLAYVGLMGGILWNVRDVGGLIVQLATGLVSYERVAEIIEEEREPLDDRSAPSDQVLGAFVFDHVHFAYDGGSQVLEDVSFQVEPGQVVALVGSTGSGKTSLVNLVPRFYEYTGGSVTLDGMDLKDYPRHLLREQIGIVEQEPFLFSRTIRENIACGAGQEVTDREIEAAAQMAAIHDEIMSFPKGYDTLVGEKGVTLSGGQKQRVAIARALLRAPRILILDDATASVDVETEVEIREALERLMQGRTTFIVTHRIQSARNADLIMVLDEGRVVQQGTHDELVAQEGIYHQMCDVQARIEEELEKEISSGG